MVNIANDMSWEGSLNDARRGGLYHDNIMIQFEGYAKASTCFAIHDESTNLV